MGKGPCSHLPYKHSTQKRKPGRTHSAKRRDPRYDPNAKAAAAEKFTSVKNLAGLSLQVKVIIDYSWEMPDSCHVFKILQPC